MGCFFKFSSNTDKIFIQVCFDNVLNPIYLFYPAFADMKRRGAVFD